MAKIIIQLSVLFFTFTSFAQQMNADEWEQQARSNIRLLPKYGYRQKTAEQKKADEQFINETMELEQFNGDRTAASNHLIQLGFTYLYNGDIKTSMYRFNQAYLLDSTNTDIYWGFGAVYMTLGNYEKAKQQYLEGISIQPKNTHLLTDYGTYFMSQYSVRSQKPANDELKAMIHLDSALKYFTKSFLIDSRDKNTAFKLSACYYYKNDCGNAWKYYDHCVTLGGETISEEFSKDLKKKCNRKK